MKLCDTCGNDIENDTRICPFCETPQGATSPSHDKPSRYITINIKEDSPTVEKAITRTEQKFSSAKQQGAKIVRLIHGYGSGGSGGDIKRTLLSILSAWQRQGKIRSYVNGEMYSQHSDGGMDLLYRYPELKNTLRSDRKNPGITFVEL